MTSAAPMDTAANDVSSMFMPQAFGADASLANTHFAASVVDQMMSGQIMGGLEQAAPAPSSTSAAERSSRSQPSSSSPPSPPAPVGPPVPMTGPGLPVIPPVPKHGPMSRRRGLAYAQHVKAVAREEFKDRRRHELEANGEGERTKRRKKNDTSMTERQKYRRRLQKNQDSAAAARFAQDAYTNCLETQVERYDNDMNKVMNENRRLEAERDEMARINTVYMNHTTQLEAELQKLREIIADRSLAPPVKQPSSAVAAAVDAMEAAWGAASTPTQPFAPHESAPPLYNKALFEEYSAGTYDFNFDISVGNVVGTKLPPAC